jgi:Xaa-Pro dipeptidase
VALVTAERDWRFGRLRRAMGEAGIDGLLAYGPAWRRENVRYLTGGHIRGSMSLAYLAASGGVTAFGRPGDPAALSGGWLDDLRPLDLPGCGELLARLREGGAPRRLGIAHLELLPQVIADALRAGLPGSDLVSATPLMDRVRLVKSPEEIARMRRTATVCDAGWRAFVAALRPGLWEHEIVANVEYELKRLGAEDNFMLIASGGDEVLGMTPPRARQLRPGDMVRTELTPQVDGYWAQICRSAVLGEPSSGQLRSFDLFLEALEAGIAATRAGVTAADVARAENDVFRRHGYGEYCTSRWTRVRGHGHGLHVDEVPALLEDDETVLEENSVIIIHPNTYTPLAGYHVLGDPVVVTRDGCETLIATERRLFVAPG